MKSLRTVLIALFVLDLFGVAGLWYGSIALQGEKQREISLRQDVLVQEEEGKKMLGLKRVLQSTAQERNSLSKFLFRSTDEDQIKFISSIERLGTSTSGAIVETSNLDSSKSGVLSGDFSVKGSWPQLFHVLRLVEEYPARIVVTRMEAKQTDETWIGSLKIDLLSIKSAPVVTPTK